jgi:hypothetical protein
MKKFFVLLPFIIFGFTACEDVIDVKLDDKDMGLFAVDARITTVDNPYVFLTKSTLVTSDEEPVGISDAIIKLTDNASPGNSITLMEDPIRKGYYTVPSGFDYYGVEGREYTLTIESQDVTMTAKDYLARVEPIDSIQIHPSKYGDMRFLAVALFSKETPGVGNLYRWEVFVNDTLLNKTEEMAFASDEWVDGNYVNDLEIFIDFHDPDKEEDRKLNMYDTVFIRQNSMSQMAYDFYLEMVNQNDGGFLFSVPPANAQGNFTSSDGKTVLGMFTAQDVSISNTVIIDETIENKLSKD